MVNKFSYATQLGSALWFGLALLWAAVLFSLQLLINTIKGRLVKLAGPVTEWHSGPATDPLFVAPAQKDPVSAVQPQLSDSEVDSLLGTEGLPRIPAPKAHRRAEAPAAEAGRFHRRTAKQRR